jgi:hypothetical protein
MNSALYWTGEFITLSVRAWRRAAMHVALNSTELFDPVPRSIIDVFTVIVSLPPS